MGTTPAEEAATLTARYTGGEQIGYSADGTTRTTLLPRTGVDSWVAPSGGDPSTISNAGMLGSPPATADVTITHTAIYGADGTQRTDWQALAAPITLREGDYITHAPGAIRIHAQ